MERLEAKRVKGHTYYYYSKWARVDNRCRRVWQRYLGKLEDIVAAVQGRGPAPIAAEVFQWGLPQALWQEATRAQLVDLIDRHCPKRRQGLTTGQYLAIAAINRAISPRSKRSMWVWFSQTVLRRHMPSASEAALASQRFWDHMDSVTPEAAAAMWKDLLKGVIDREQIDLSSIGYDGTNFYTFLDTFNTRCNLAARGKNKQGRDNLRQVSYALFCTTDGQLPLFYDVYQGNRNDARQFSEVLQRFHRFFSDLSGREGVVPATTLIFDKGNNSAANFRLLDELKLKFVGSVKHKEHPELAAIPHTDRRFLACSSPGLKGVKTFRVTKQGSSLFQDAQSGEESTDLRCVSAKCLRDVGYAHGPQQADRRVSEGSHHFRTGTLADPARVLAHCDVTYVVRTILDRPMPPGPFEQLSRAGHRPRNTGDEVADLVRGLAVLDHLALDLSDLANTRPIQIIVQRRRRLQRATLDSTVSLVEGRRRVHGVIPDSLLPRGKKPLPREGRRPSGCHSGASVGCL